MSQSRPSLHMIAGLLWVAVAATLLVSVGAQAGRAEGAIRKMDHDDDGMLSRSEWRKKRLFKRFDADGDGQISLQELREQFGESTATGSSPADDSPPAPAMREMPDPKTMAAIRRSERRGDDIRDAIDRGLLETGLHPTWPDSVNCPDIDHWFAMDYREYRGKEAYHGGIDIPVPYDVPVRAAMDGEVIAKFMGHQTPRGIEIVLRHTPEDSGLPYYIYTRYTHFKTLPTLKVGQRVKLGDVLGPTGNSGKTNCQVCRKQRRSLLHFDVLYTKDERFFSNDKIVIPFDAHWMDPVALFRKQPPFESSAMKALPEAEKRVTVSYMLEDGSMYPAGTRMIWPYACESKSRAAAARPANTQEEGGISSVLDL